MFANSFVAAVACLYYGLVGIPENFDTKVDVDDALMMYADGVVDEGISEFGD
jgi:hypothetical protein